MTRTHRFQNDVSVEISNIFFQQSTLNAPVVSNIETKRLDWEKGVQLAVEQRQKVDACHELKWTKSNFTILDTLYRYESRYVLHDMYKLLSLDWLD